MASKRLLIISLFFFLLLPGILTAQTPAPLRYTSFYPAPYGEFSRLRFVPQPETPCGGTTGTACPQIYGAWGNPCAQPGMMYFNSTATMFYSCNTDPTLPPNALNTQLNWGFLPGVWKQEGNNLFLTDTDPATSVGIGTAPDNAPFKLTLENDGAIFMFGQGVAAVPDSPSRNDYTRLLWVPSRFAFSVGGIHRNPIILPPPPAPLPAAALAYTPAGTFFPAHINDYRLGTGTITFGINNVAPTASNSGILGGEYSRIMNSNNAVIINSALGAAITDSNASVVINGTITGDSTNPDRFNENFAAGSQARIRNSRRSTILNSGLIDSADYSFIGGALPNTPEPVGSPFGGYYNPYLDVLFANDSAKFPAANASITDTYGAAITSQPDSNNDGIGDCDGNGAMTHGTILAGYGLINCSSHAFIGGGSQHLIHQSPRSLILGGKRNTIQFSQASSIMGGENNTAGGSASSEQNFQFIGGGKNNQTWTDYSLIGGGENNRAGGYRDLTAHPLWTHATHATIGGGKDNKAFGLFSFIGGGQENQVGSCVDADNDNICDTPIIADPDINDGQHSVIFGGQNNTILGNFSVIGSGLGNTIGSNGHYSVIEGGENITVNGSHSWAFGRNVTVNGNNVWAWGYSDNNASPVVIDNNDVFIIYNKISGSDPNPNMRVGIQTTNPQTTFHVNGEVVASTLKIVNNPPGGGGSKLKYNPSNNQIEFFDLAELFDASEPVSPGDLLALDPDSEDIRLIKSRRPYEKGIVGVVSSAPALVFKGSEIITDFQYTKDAITNPPVALTGRVPCNISLENGPIEYGDLLTSSSTPGYAMKATDREQAFGAIIGKALEPFNTDISNGQPTGTINIFVAMQ